MLHRKKRVSKLTPEIVAAAHDGKRRREPRDRLAKRLGVSTGTISRAWKMPEPARRAAPPVVRPAPASAAAEQVDADDASDAALRAEPETVLDRLLREQAEALDSPAVRAEDARLSRAISDASSPSAANAIEIERAMLVPIFRHYVMAGDSRVASLSLAGEHPLVLCRAEDLATLAVWVTDDPSATDDDKIEHRERALRLLAAASQIVATDPEVLS